MPLRHEGRGDQNQDAPCHATQQVLAEQQAGLNRFPQTNFIGQQHAAAKMPQDLANRLNLVRQMLNAVQPLQAQQLVKAAQETQPGQFLMEPQIARLGRAVTWQQRLDTERNGDSPGACPAIRKRIVDRGAPGLGDGIGICVYQMLLRKEVSQSHGIHSSRYRLG